MGWIEKHSVECIKCDNMVDERECITAPDNEGSICQDCAEKLPTFSIPYTSKETGHILIQAVNQKHAISLFEDGQGDYQDEHRDNEYFPEQIKIVKVEE